jgi:putative redox protein
MVKMKVVYKGNLHTECTNEFGAKIETDAPKEYQGKGELFSPTDLFAASLATCMLTSMGMAAVKMGIDLKGTTADAEKEMVTAPHRHIGKITVQIRSALSPNSMEREKLEKAARECVVHRALHPDIRVEVGFIWGL